jgi:hypothetical protein
MIYTGFSRERPLAPGSFYFRAEQTNNIFQVKYLSHVEYTLKNFAICPAYAHDIINRLMWGAMISRGTAESIDLDQRIGHLAHL